MLQTLSFVMIAWTLAAFGFGMILGRFIKDHPEADERLTTNKSAGRSHHLSPHRA